MLKFSYFFTYYSTPSVAVVIVVMTSSLLTQKEQKSQVPAVSKHARDVRLKFQ